MASDTPASCYDKAVELLARRSHFEAELRRKLLARRFGRDEVESTLARLRERGYVDDPRTAAQWVASELERRPQGRRRLLHTLARKGVDGGVAEGALEELDDRAELELARRAAAVWSGRGGGARRDRLARHLDGRGFGKRVILSVLEERFEGFAEDPCEGPSCADAEGVEPA